MDNTLELRKLTGVFASKNLALYLRKKCKDVQGCECDLRQFARLEVNRKDLTHSWMPADVGSDAVRDDLVCGAIGGLGGIELA